MPVTGVWVPGGVESHFPSHPNDIPGAGMPLTSDITRYIGDGVAALADENTGIRNLRTLIIGNESNDFSAPRVTDVGVAALAAKGTGLKALVSLTLVGMSVGDDGVAALAAKDTGLWNLRSLDISFTSVTDKGVEAVAAKGTGLENLTTLILPRRVSFFTDRHLTNKGLAALAAQDCGIKNLKVLNLSGNEVSDTVAAAIKKRFPGITIIR